ncbi:MAG TPA: hypothetical protein VF756_06645 [Thermoanaerobaculia bacterium]
MDRTIPGGRARSKSGAFGRALLMNAAKEEVMRILELLLDDTSLEDIQYHIYVLQKIDHGLEDIEEGRTLSEEELEQRMARWLEP